MEYLLPRELAMAAQRIYQPAQDTPPAVYVDVDPGSIRNGTAPEGEWGHLVERLANVLTEPDTAEWMTVPAIQLLSVFRGHPRFWGLSKATYKKWGGNAYDLEKAVDHYRALHGGDDTLTAPAPAVDPFIFTDVRSILAHEPQPRRWLLPGIIADGLTLLGGSPKGGKTYLAYALALGVSHYGTWCNHWEVEPGKVIYITLEDDENDTHLRLLELDPALQIDVNRLLF